MIRVTYRGQRKYFATGISGSKEHWNKGIGLFEVMIGDLKIPGSQKKNRKIETELTRVDRKIKELKDKDDLSLHRLKEILRPDLEIDFFEFANKLIEEMEQRGQVGNAAVYRDTCSSLQAFLAGETKSKNGTKEDKIEKKKIRKSQVLKFQHIHKKFLTTYVGWLSDYQLTKSSKSTYLRTIRAIYNKAIAKEIVDSHRYPFTRGGLKDDKKFNLADYKVASRPRALSKSQIDKFKEFTPRNYQEAEAKRCFLFSYYSRGMNLTDMARLTSKNIIDDRIVYVREKTKAKKENEPLSVKVSDHLQDILDYYGQFGGRYLLAILDESTVTPQQKRTRIRTKARALNKALKKIASELGFSEKLSMYWARHTYATVLYRSNVATEKISIALGHSELKTTQIYLREFGQHEIDHVDGHL